MTSNTDQIRGKDSVRSNSTLNRRRFTGGVATAAAMPIALGAASLPQRAGAQEPTQVTFWQFNTEDFIIAAWQTAIDAFQTANPDVVVNMEIVPWREQHQKLVTGLATGALPDVSMLGNNVVAEFQALGALAPMGEYFSQWSTEAGTDITTDFWPGDVLYYNLQGEWWASPVAEETRCVYYRRDLFESAGLGTEAPTTFDQMRDFAIALTSGDTYGIGIPGGINYGTVQTFMSVYLGYGARMLNDDGTSAFDSPEFREALTWYTNLYTTDKVSPPDTPTYDNETLAQLFIDGRIAMFVNGPSFRAQLEGANPAFLDGVAIGQIPAGPAGQFGFLGGWPLVMWNTSEVKDAAFRWIKYATDPQGGLPQLAQTTGNLPGRRSLAQTAPWNEAPLSTFAQQMEFAVPYQYPSPAIAQMGTLEVDAVQTAVQNVMLGQDTVDDATTSLVQRIDEVLSR